MWTTPSSRVRSPPPLYSFSFYCLPSFLLLLYTLYTENYAPSPFPFDPTPPHIYHPLISVLFKPAPSWLYSTASGPLLRLFFALPLFFCISITRSCMCHLLYAQRLPPSHPSVVAWSRRRFRHAVRPHTPTFSSPTPHPTSSLSPGILLFSLSLCRAALGLSRPMAPHNTESLTQTFCYFVCCSITCGFLFSF